MVLNFKKNKKYLNFLRLDHNLSNVLVLLIPFIFFIFLSYPYLFGNSIIYHDNLPTLSYIHISLSHLLEGKIPLWSHNLNNGMAIWPHSEISIGLDPILILVSFIGKINKVSLDTILFVTLALWLITFTYGIYLLLSKLKINKILITSALILVLCGPIWTSLPGQGTGLLIPFRYFPFQIIYLIYFLKKPNFKSSLIFIIINCFSFSGYQTIYNIIPFFIFSLTYLAVCILQHKETIHVKKIFYSCFFICSVVFVFSIPQLIAYKYLVENFVVINRTVVEDSYFLNIKQIIIDLFFPLNSGPHINHGPFWLGFVLKNITLLSFSLLLINFFNLKKHFVHFIQKTKNQNFNIIFSFIILLIISFIFISSNSLSFSYENPDYFLGLRNWGFLSTVCYISIIIIGFYFINNLSIYKLLIQNNVIYLYILLSLILTCFLYFTFTNNKDLCTTNNFCLDNIFSKRLFLNISLITFISGISIIFLFRNLNQKLLSVFICFLVSIEVLNLDQPEPIINKSHKDYNSVYLKYNESDFNKKINMEFPFEKFLPFIFEGSEIWNQPSIQLTPNIDDYFNKNKLDYRHYKISIPPASIAFNSKDYKNLYDLRIKNETKNKLLGWEKNKIEVMHNSIFYEKLGQTNILDYNFSKQFSFLRNIPFTKIVKDKDFSAENINTSIKHYLKDKKFMFSMWIKFDNTNFSSLQTVLDFSHSSTNGCALQANVQKENYFLDISWICNGIAKTQKISKNTWYYINGGYDQKSKDYWISINDKNPLHIKNVKPFENINKEISVGYFLKNKNRFFHGRIYDFNIFYSQNLSIDKNNIILEGIFNKPKDSLNLNKSIIERVNLNNYFFIQDKKPPETIQYNDKKNKDINLNIIKFKRTKIIVKMNEESPTNLVLNKGLDNFWQAEINGQQHKLLETNFFSKTLRVPPGKNVIELSYEPNFYKFAYIIRLFMFVIFNIYLLYLFVNYLIMIFKQSYKI